MWQFKFSNFPTFHLTHYRKQNKYIKWCYLCLSLPFWVHIYNYINDIIVKLYLKFQHIVLVDQRVIHAPSIYLHIVPNMIKSSKFHGVEFHSCILIIRIQCNIRCTFSSTDIVLIGSQVRHDIAGNSPGSDSSDTAPVEVD